MQELLGSSPRKKPKRHPIHQNKNENEDELDLTGNNMADEELAQVLDDIYAKAGESCKCTKLNLGSCLLHTDTTLLYP